MNQKRARIRAWAIAEAAKYAKRTALTKVTRRLKGQDIGVGARARLSLAQWMTDTFDKAVFSALSAPRDPGKAFAIARPEQTRLYGKHADTLILDDLAFHSGDKWDDDQVDALRYAMSAFAPTPPADREILAKITARLKMPVKAARLKMPVKAARLPSPFNTLFGYKVTRPGDFGVISVGCTT